jgi:maltose alpha-D-glucosyltransferase/alpha-amylase
VLAARVLEQEDAIVSRFRAIFDQRVKSMRTRYHGRLHLGHLLVRNGDVTMFDFEGDPNLHLSERRIKRCPLRDVASMLHSFGYAAQSSVRQLISAERNEMAALQRLRVWARFWYSHISAAFLRGYWITAKGAPYLPEPLEHQQLLLATNLLENALLDIRADISDKRELAGMPVRVILHLLDAEAERRM